MRYKLRININGYLRNVYTFSAENSLGNGSRVMLKDTVMEYIFICHKVTVTHSLMHGKNNTCK